MARDRCRVPRVKNVLLLPRRQTLTNPTGTTHQGFLARHVRAFPIVFLAVFFYVYFHSFPCPVLNRWDVSKCRKNNTIAWPNLQESCQSEKPPRKHIDRRRERVRTAIVR